MRIRKENALSLSFFLNFIIHIGKTMNNKTDFSIGMGILLLCAVMFQQIMLLPPPEGSEPFSARSFPLGITIFLSILSILLICSSFKKQAAASAWPESAILAKIGLMALAIFLYVMAFMFIGEFSIQHAWPVGVVFIASTIVFLFAAQLVTGYRNIAKISLISVTASVLFYFIFVHFFKVPLP